MLKVFPLASREERKEKREQLALIKSFFFFFFPKAVSACKDLVQGALKSLLSVEKEGAEGNLGHWHCARVAMAIPQKGSLIGFLPRKLKTAARRLQSGACKNIFMNRISVENFVGCLHPPFGSRAMRKVVEDHLAVAGDMRRGQGHCGGSRGNAQGMANLSAQHRRCEPLKNTDDGDPPWHTERCFSKQAGPTSWLP